MASPCCWDLWRYSISIASSRSLSLKYLMMTTAREGSPTASRTMTMKASAGMSIGGMSALRSRPARISPRAPGCAPNGRGSDVSLDEEVQILLWQRPRHAPKQQRSALKQQRRDRLHLVHRADPRVLVDVQLHDLQLALPLLRRLLEHRSDGAARAAPRRPEIHQHRDGAVLHFALPGRVARGDGLVGEDALLAPPATRILAQARAGDPVRRAALGAGILDPIVVHAEVVIICAGRSNRANP